MTRFCAPTAISIITGKTYDQAVDTLQALAIGEREVTGVWLDAIACTLRVLGYQLESINENTKLYLLSPSATYLIHVRGHVAVVRGLPLVRSQLSDGPRSSQMQTPRNLQDNSMPKQILILDSSQIDSFSTCPQQWEYGYKESITHTNLIDDAMVAGTLGHKYLEIYYTAIGKGLGSGDAAALAMTFDPDAADTTDHHNYPLNKDIRFQVWNRFVDYLMTWSSRDYTPLTKQTPAIVIDPETGLPKDVVQVVPLVEQGFSYELLSTREYLFVLEGRIDFIGETNGTTVWMDHKWQFRERELYKKSIQFRNYALVTGLSLGVINYIRLHKKISETTFVRQPISFSALERRYWREELIEIYIAIARDMAAGRFEKRRSSCPGKFGYKCQFTDLCEEYNPGTVQAIKQRDFVKKIEWRPW